jgi:chromosome segregation ATPase
LASKRNLTNHRLDQLSDRDIRALVSGNDKLNDQLRRLNASISVTKDNLAIVHRQRAENDRALLTCEALLRDAKEVIAVKDCKLQEARDALSVRDAELLEARNTIADQDVELQHMRETIIYKNTIIFNQQKSISITSGTVSPQNRLAQI